MNSVVISGKLGRDPELSYTPQTQTACCRLSVAVPRQKREEQPDWVKVTVWGKQAENCKQYLVKGQKVEVAGRLRTSKGKDGKEYTEVVASVIEFGEKPKERNEHVAQPVQDVVNDFSAPEGFSATDDYVPF